jgi:hypothetical protein
MMKVGKGIVRQERGHYGRKREKSRRRKRQCDKVWSFEVMGKR